MLLLHSASLSFSKYHDFNLHFSPNTETNDVSKLNNWYKSDKHKKKSQKYDQLHIF